MRVSKLQELLKKFEPDEEVICYCEDINFQKDNTFCILDIVSVNATQAERVRLDDGTPSLKIGKSPFSESLITIEVTTGF